MTLAALLPARRRLLALGIVPLALALPARSTPENPASAAAGAGWIDLFDAKLTRWELWLGVPHESVRGLPPGTPQSADGHVGTPLGLGRDPKHVFTLVEQGGEPVLHVTGEIFGGLTTLAAFGDYHLRLETKWGEKIWPPKIGKPRDSGLLIHCTGEHGKFWNVWMSTLEFQIQENDCGDLYCLAGTSAIVPSRPAGKMRAYQPGGDPAVIGARPGAHGLMCQRSANHERPGDWNLVEIYTVGDHAVFLVNGRVVNVLLETKIMADGALRPLTAGKIQLQSEGAEVYFRRLQLRPLAAFPAEILAAAGLTPAR